MNTHTNANAHPRKQLSDDPFVLTPPRPGRLASPRLVERGVDYALRGRVLEVRARGGKLEARVEEFERLVHEVCREAGRKAVVFTQWEIFQRMAAERAREAGVEYVRLHGGVPTHKRGDLIARFRDDPDCRLFLCADEFSRSPREATSGYLSKPGFNQGLVIQPPRLVY